MVGAETKKRRDDRRSPEAAEYRRLYKSARWRMLRIHQLAAHPLCQRCSTDDHPVPATVVHHTVEHKGDLALFFDPENVESVCSPCHDGPIQQTEKLGFSLEVGADGFPTDPNHPFNR